MNDTALPMPNTFPEHATTGGFYCWCIPYHELVRTADGWALLIVHFSRPIN